MNIVLIETSGNQRYIFATNKLRENIGASQLTYRVGTEFIDDAIKNERVSGGEVIEIIATSGKAIFLVSDGESGAQIICEVTARALREMPGLVVHGATVGEVKDDLSNIDEKIKEVHEKHAQIRFQMPSNEQRFLRLPFAAPCDTSGLPAQHKRRYEGEDREKLYSLVSCIKSENKKSGQARIAKLLGRNDLIEPLKIYEREWVAVIHADGNGVGNIFQNFKRYSQTSEDQYLIAFKSFSDALDDCTVKATNYALDELKKQLNEEKLPVVPLVLGGDDLTVLCDGRVALNFTHNFLQQFEKETSSKDIVEKIASNAFQVNYLGICAGIAIIKPHYPFHQAYELAEQLLKSAKQVKEKVQQELQRNGAKVNEQLPCSALDFHILYDSAHSELSEIRDEKLKVASETYLCAKPYVVTKTLDGQKNNDWLRYRKFEELQKRVKAMSAPAEDDATRRALPNSKLHEIRQSLFRGKDVADVEATLVKNRLSSSKKKPEDKSAKEIFEKELLIEEKTLFFNESGKFFTHFLDAIEAVDFWKGFDSKEEKSSAGNNQPAEPATENEVTK